MGGSASLDPGAILANLVISTVVGGVGSAASRGERGSSGQASAEAEAQRLADEREAKARRAEDRRAEEAVLKAQKQKLSQGGQAATLSTTLGATLGEDGSLAGQSMHGSAPIAAPQLKEKLGQ